MIEAKVTSTANKTLKASVFLKNQLARSIRLERGLEKKSITVKTKLLKDRDRTLKALLSRSKEDKKDKKGVVGTLGVLGGGLIGRRFLGRGGGGIGRVPKIPRLPTRGGAVLSRSSKVGRLGRFGPLAVIGTGLDFAGRRAEGQTNLQAGVGAGGGLAGALAGAKAGAVLGTTLGGPIGTVVGGVGGSIIGSLAGGRLADLFTGADRRRKFEERRAILSSEKTLFSESLDDLDRVLDKLEDSNFLGAVRKAKDDKEEDRPRFLIPRPIIPLGGAKVDGKSFQRVVGEELAKYAAIAGVTFLLIPSDPTDVATTAPLAIKLQALAKSTRLFKALKAIFLKPPKVLQPGKDIPGISAKGIRIRAEALMKKLNPNIKFDRPKVKPKFRKIKTKVKDSDIQDLIKKGNLSEESPIFELFKPKTKKINTNVERGSGKNLNPSKNKTPKREINNTENMERFKNKDLTDAGGISGSDIALAPTNNIFLIKEGDTNISPPAVFNEGDTIVFGGSGSSSDLSKYVEMTQLFTT